jgi:hypothetical protein
MTLSSVYKEIALGETELDPVFLNGWIAIFQFLLSIPLAIPAAIAGEPRVYPDKLPDNLYNGSKSCAAGPHARDLQLLVPHALAAAISCLFQLLQ